MGMEGSWGGSSPTFFVRKEESLAVPLTEMPLGAEPAALLGVKHQENIKKLRQQ